MSEEKTIIKQLNQDEIRDFILKKDYELYKYKKILDKIKEIILNHKDYETEGLLVEETSNILELLEEIE